MLCPFRGSAARRMLEVSHVRVVVVGMAVVAIGFCDTPVKRARWRPRKKKNSPEGVCVFSSQRAVRRGKRGEAQTECLRSTGSAKEALHLR